MMTKTYTLPNGKKAVFEYDVCGIGKITLECMDELMSMIADRPQKVIAQITFDEEKLREIVKEAVERFKEEYEIIDRPQGEWIAVSAFDAFGGDEATWMAHGNPTAFHYCSECKEQSRLDEFGEEMLSKYCPNCGAKMKGAGDE